MKVLSHRRYILYVGNFLTPEVRAIRGLPTLNPAGSNRMERLAGAIHAVGQRVVILSPAASLRMSYQGSLLHLSQCGRHGTIPVVFSACVGLPLLGMLSSSIFLLLTVLRFSRRKKIGALVLYNFNVTQVLLGFVAKWVLRVPVFNNIEDVSVVRSSDWSRKRSARPLQQLVFSGCMHLVAWLSQGLIVPTRRFLDHVGRGRASLLVTGCILPRHSRRKTSGDRRLWVLLAGKIEQEHGSEVFAAMLQNLSASTDGRLIEFHVTGGGAGMEEIQKLSALEGIELKIHGFMERRDYENLLAEIDVCLVLQMPEGRYASFKTPSKTYEFIGHGKVVVTTNVGDLAELPRDFVHIVEPVPAIIQELLVKFGRDLNGVEQGKELAFKFASDNFSYEMVGKRLVNFLCERGARLGH